MENANYIQIIFEYIVQNYSLIESMNLYRIIYIVYIKYKLYNK